MATWTAFTTLDDQMAAARLGDALEALEPAGVGVFALEDGSGRWEVGGYFTAPPDEVALALLAAAHGGRAFAVSELADTDWVDKVRRDLTPVEAGRFFLYGSHDADKVPDGRMGLLIDAAMAFGTGHHGTTVGCLLAIDALAGTLAPARIADIGCGTGVLAMAAAKAWHEAEIVASDIDAQAVEVARANLRANGLEARIGLVEAAGFDHADLAGPFDLILANILKRPLIALAPDIGARLRAGGRAVLSGLLTGQADDVSAAYAGAGLKEVRREVQGEWATLELAQVG